MQRLGILAAALAVSALGCEAADTVGPPVTLPFLADPGAAGEEYLCFGFDATLLDGADLGGIELVAAESPITLHHVALYASPSAFPDGPVECEGMPADAVSLNVWAIGGGPLAMPDDVELAIPAGTERLVVQAHAIRYGDGPPVTRDLVLTPRQGATHRAGWLPLRAPTPALRPEHIEESTATCSLADELHVISTWPHMHEAGRSFRGTVLGADGSNDGSGVYVSIADWSYDAQHAYPVDVVVAPSQMIETDCVWSNDTDQTILPGPSIHDEMCAQSLIAWPVEAAHCE